MNRITLIPCLALLSLLLGWGQLPAEQIRQIEFRAYAQYPVRGVEYLPVDASAIAADTPAKAPIQIETHSQSRTGPYAFTGGDHISFHETGGGACVARVSLPATSDRWLLVFMRNPLYQQDPAEHLKYRIYPFDDSLRNLPANGLVFLNISGKELAGRLDNKRIGLGAIGQLPDTGKPAGESMGTRI